MSIVTIGAIVATLLSGCDLLLEFQSKQPKVLTIAVFILALCIALAGLGIVKSVPFG